MDERIPDQTARDMAAQALSEIRQHAAVCQEVEKRRMAFQQNMEDWMKRIQISYEAGQADMSHRHSSAVNQLADNVGKVNQTLMSRMDVLSGTIASHAEHDSKLFAELARERSFLTGGWKTVIIFAATFYAIAELSLSLYSITHH